MKFFSALAAVCLFLMLPGCANNQGGSQEESIRASVRRQDSIGAKDRLDRLKRQVREEQRVDTLRDTTSVSEE